MTLIKEVERKSMQIRESGRSSDFISPSFGFGCLLNCSYCYMKRHLPEGLTIANNPNIILSSINDHANFCTISKPNQTDDYFITYDIACNEDFALHSKYHKWKGIFSFFVDHPRAKATLATKIIPDWYLGFPSRRKIRIRFSLMPQEYSTLLEPNTPSIIERINAVNTFIEDGWDVHLNFSPVIVEDGWLDKYKELFTLCNEIIKYKELVKCEVIFLTHNIKKHNNNLFNKLTGEELIWKPDIQESKQSQYGDLNLRYKHPNKTHYIREFIELHNFIIPWCKIRYIF